MWAWSRRKVQEEGAEGYNAAPSVAAPGATSSECPKCAQLPAKIETTLSECKERVHEQIQFAQNMSEKEIMAIGESVQNIVNHTRQYIDESKDVVVKNLADQSLSLSDYLTYTKQATEIQGDTVKEALALSDNITHAGLAVDKLANQARLLALNAKIEAARLGSAGSAFGVITEEMNHLSMEIAKTNRMIAESTQAIQACLPMLAEQGTTQMMRVEEFSQTMQAFKDGIENAISTTNHASDSHITQILNLAYEALSHLQFQDPMIQSVQKIDVLVQDLHGELRKYLGLAESGEKRSAYIHTLGTKIAKQQDDSKDQPDAGEV
jgi:methyl-accepting chemotaxis protein